MAHCNEKARSAGSKQMVLCRHAPLRVFVSSCLILLLLVGTFGCSPSTAVSAGHNTALDSVDLTTMTDQMASRMAGEPKVSEAIQQHGKLAIVIQPVENRLTGEVLPRGQAEAFTARVRYLISRHVPQRFTWVMNRDDFYKMRAKEVDFDLGPAPDRIQPTHALTARFSSLTDESSKRRTAAYLCVFELTNLKDGTVLWNDKYEVQKTAVKGFLD